LKIGFFAQKTNEASLVHFEMAQGLMDSARKAMPGVHLAHLTDGDSPAVKGADQVIRIAEKMPMAVRRMTHNSRLRGDWLLVDTDIIIKGDVREVFKQPFDIALTDREGTITYEHKYAQAMPYNLGVVFSRCPAFWLQVLKYLVKAPERYQQWEGDQQVVCQMVKMGLDKQAGFEVKILPGRQYNYPPKHRDDTEAKILHYKGARKQYLFQEAT